MELNRCIKYSQLYNKEQYSYTISASSIVIIIQFVFQFHRFIYEHPYPQSIVKIEKSTETLT